MKTLLFFVFVIAGIATYFRYLRTEEPLLLSVNDFDNESLLIEVDHPGIIYDKTKKYITDGKNHQKFYHYTSKLRCDKSLEETLRCLLASNQDGEKYEYACLSEK